MKNGVTRLIILGLSTMGSLAVVGDTLVLALGYPPPVGLTAVSGACAGALASLLARTEEPRREPWREGEPLPGGEQRQED